MKRTAHAQWSGNLMEGKGTLTAPSGILNKTNYSFKTRFEEGITGTNPEELIAAAHAGCFTMALGNILSTKGFVPESLDTTAAVSLENFVITGVHLNVTGKVPGITAEGFIEATKDAEKNCPVSKALGVPITSEAQLV